MHSRIQMYLYLRHSDRFACGRRQNQHQSVSGSRAVSIWFGEVSPGVSLQPIRYQLAKQTQLENRMPPPRESHYVLMPTRWAHWAGKCMWRGLQFCEPAQLMIKNHTTNSAPSTGIILPRASRVWPMWSRATPFGKSWHHLLALLGWLGMLGSKVIVHLSIYLVWFTFGMAHKTHSHIEWRSSPSGVYRGCSSGCRACQWLFFHDFNENLLEKSAGLSLPFCSRIAAAWAF